ncbi:MAG TPA: 50S ribosomal protein L25 [Cytophagales bacterium]|jgi:large subunit ribosomal protein L25|nr:50S ribosomal protein L25 [Cytophagales bacterium]
MKTVEIIGYKRANLGKKDSKDLRAEAMVPCVLYGGSEQIHFYSPMILFRPLVYTQDVYKVLLNIEGDTHEAFLQATQFHPVSDVMLHADFLLIRNDKKVKIEVPIRFKGTALGVTKGGKLVQKVEKIKVLALPEDLPSFLEVDVTDLDLSKSVRVSDIPAGNFKVLNAPAIPVATVTVPRALKGKEEAAAK